MLEEERVFKLAGSFCLDLLWIGIRIKLQQKHTPTFSAGWKVKTMISKCKTWHLVCQLCLQATPQLQHTRLEWSLSRTASRRSEDTEAKLPVPCSIPLLPSWVWSPAVLQLSRGRKKAAQPLASSWCCQITSHCFQVALACCRHHVSRAHIPNPLCHCHLCPRENSTQPCTQRGSWLHLCRQFQVRSVRLF